MDTKLTGDYVIQLAEVRVELSAEDTWVISGQEARSKTTGMPVNWSGS